MALLLCLRTILNFDGGRLHRSAPLHPSPIPGLLAESTHHDGFRIRGDVREVYIADTSPMGRKCVRYLRAILFGREGLFPSCDRDWEEYREKIARSFGSDYILIFMT